MSPTQVVDDDYFNDLSRQPYSRQNSAGTPPDQNGNAVNNEDSALPKAKRVACVICRKRKLRCDGGRPKCATCARLGHQCAYDEVRRKSGPKRGYVKELEARLAQVETQLKTKTVENTRQPATESSQPENQPLQTTMSENIFTSSISNGNLMEDDMMKGGLDISGSINSPFDSLDQQQDGTFNGGQLPDLGLGFDDTMSWEMIGLGLEEALPTVEAMEELHQLYFEKVHPSVPMIHPYRYRASLDLAPHMRPPVCLRYAMWCLASSVSDRYFSHQEIFYRRARKYAEMDEMKGQGESFVSIAHCQTWSLLATYEFKMMFFPRAWASVGRTVRLAMMMGLNRVDGVGMDVKQCIPPPSDWTEREQRRRTFWMAYCVDRYASMGTGWPMAIDEKDIMTNLPSTEEAYEKSVPQTTMKLSASMTSEGAASLSSFAAVVFMAYVFGRNLTHLHRPETDDAEADLQGKFWKRHRQIDNLLLNTSLSLPSHLRLPAKIRDANVVFVNMSIHTSTICLHQAAIFKAEQNNLPSSIIEQSNTRCFLAATEITTIMRLISHIDCMDMNPFISFCLYVAARVFLHALKKKPDDQEVRSSLEFLLGAMQQLRRKNPLSESFLIQLSLDLEGTGLDILLHNPDRSSKFAKMSMAKMNHNASGGDGCASFGGANLKSQDGYFFKRFPQSKESPPKDAFSVGDSIFRSSDYQPDAQYSMHQFEVTAREQRSLSTEYQSNLVPPVPEQLQKLACGQGWGDQTSGGSTRMADMMSNNYETDMSDRSGSGGQNSQGLTPNTAYSPPSQNGDSSNTNHDSSKNGLSDATSTLSQNANSGAVGVQSPGKFFDFSAAAAGTAAPIPSVSQSQQLGDNSMGFNIGPEWGSATGGGISVPGVVAPAQDGIWTSILEGMNWEGGTGGVEWGGGDGDNPIGG